MEDYPAYYTTKEQIDAMFGELEQAEQMHAAPAKGRVLRLLGRLAFLAVAAVLIYTLACVWIARFEGKVPTLFGFQVYRVETESMEPTLPVGSILLSRKTNANTEIKIGDVVTFHYNGSFVTHRVVELYKDDGVRCYRTMGDNPLNSIDPWTLHDADIEAVLLRKIW